MGSLGFLTNHHFKSMQEDLNEVIFGSESLEQCSIDGSVSISFCLSMFPFLPNTAFILLQLQSSCNCFGVSVLGACTALFLCTCMISAKLLKVCFLTELLRYYHHHSEHTLLSINGRGFSDVIRHMTSWSDTCRGFLFTSCTRHQLRHPMQLNALASCQGIMGMVQA